MNKINKTTYISSNLNRELRNMSNLNNFIIICMSGRRYISSDEEESSGQVGKRRMDLAGHKGGRHRQGEQAGRQVPRIRNLLQLHTSSATLSRGNLF